MGKDCSGYQNGGERCYEDKRFAHCLFSLNPGLLAPPFHYIIPARRVVKYGFCDLMRPKGALALDDGQRLIEVGNDVCGRLDPY